MRIGIVAVTLALLALTTSRIEAQAGAFCRGFDEGWKSLRGELVVPPICPIEPITPIGSTPFREGIKLGMAAAQKSGGRNSGGALSRTSRSEQDDFCDGFSEGWKTVKGDRSIVPICPIAPITPIGSTAYREGLKSGIARARSR